VQYSHKNVSLWATVAVVMVMGSFACAGDPMEPVTLGDMAPEVVATVNGVDLTRDQLAGLTIAVYGRQTLQRLVSHELIRQEAVKQGVTVTAQEIEELTRRRVSEQVAMMGRQLGFKNAEQHAAHLKSLGMSLDQLKEDARVMLRPLVGPELLSRKMIAESVTITDDDVREEFNRRFGPRVRLLQIVLEKREEAEAVIDKLKTGADFSSLAADLSRDRVSAQRGGQLEPLPEDSLLGQAVAGLEPGAISDVVTSPHGVHVLKLLERIPATDDQLVDVAERLRNELMDRGIAARSQAWLRELMLKADIDWTL